MNERRHLYVNGEWAEPHGRGEVVVENPATESVIGQVPAGDEIDIDRATSAARAAFPAWAALSRSRRAQHLRALHEALANRADDLVESIVAEVGSPVRIASRIQTNLPLDILAGYADALEEEETEERIGNSLVVREPAGVVGAITPWNYPLQQTMCKLAPALAAGCTLVLKPSELAPGAIFVLFQAIHEAGLPPGVVNLVSGDGPEAGEALAGHPDVDMVSFTGSVPAGRRVAELAARTVKRVTLELGGKSANVILDDADIATAVKVGVANAFLNSGQTCTAWTRMLVPAARQEEILSMAKGFAGNYRPGDPTDPKTRLGPVVSRQRREAVREHIAMAAEQGARRVTGGGDQPLEMDRGYFVEPTIFGDVASDSMLAQEEVFGPVLAVIPYHDESDALAIANNSRYGLHGAVWSGDQQRALAFARQVRTGAIDINGGQYNPLAPFGGYKQSGIGRELGRYGLDEFLEVKSIQL